MNAPDALARLQAADELIVRQRITAMVNRYEVHLPLEPGSKEEGDEVAYVEQARMKLKEEFTIYTGSDKSTVLAKVKATKRLDLGSRYEITDAAGASIGSFRKDFKASLLNSTFHVQDPAGEDVITARERSMVLAILRRALEWLPLGDGLLGLIPIIFHLDFRRIADGEEVASVERRVGLRDRYTVRMSADADALDRRTAVAMAVGMDALLAR
jgi:uncharacterized protein YxjI